MARHDANGPGACSTGNPQVQRPAKSAFAGGGPALDRRPMSGVRRRLTMIELCSACRHAGEPGVPIQPGSRRPRPGRVLLSLRLPLLKRDHDRRGDHPRVRRSRTFPRSRRQTELPPMSDNLNPTRDQDARALSGGKEAADRGGIERKESAKHGIRTWTVPADAAGRVHRRLAVARRSAGDDHERTDSPDQAAVRPALCPRHQGLPELRGTLVRWASSPC